MKAQIFLALTLLAGCGRVHAVGLAPVALVNPPLPHASEAASPTPEEHARAIALRGIASQRHAYQITVEHVEARDHPRVYVCDCEFWAPNGLEGVCDFTASGTVDLHDESLKLDHLVPQWCES